MNKKGFTLAELLGVIVVLAIVMGLAVYSMSTVIGTGKKGVYKNFEDTLESAAKNYLIDNIDKIPSSGTFKITYNELLEKNYVEEFQDPNGNDLNNSYVEITRGSDRDNNLDLTYNSCLVNSNGNVVSEKEECQ